MIAARTCHCVTPTLKSGESLIDVDQSLKHVSYNSCQHRQHVWCYESLEARQAAREVVWQATQEQWQEIVARTVPLIRCDLAFNLILDSIFISVCHQEDEQQGIGAIAHQYHQVNQERISILLTNHYSSDH